MTGKDSWAQDKVADTSLIADGSDPADAISLPTNKKICFPQGAYIVGCGNSDTSCSPAESYIESTHGLLPFCLDEHEVTKSEYEDCASLGLCPPLCTPDTLTPGWYDLCGTWDFGTILKISLDPPNAPVRAIPWKWAKTFCEKMRKNGNLPNAWEWEAGARPLGNCGPSNTCNYDLPKFYWGYSWPPKATQGNFGVIGVDDGFAGVAPVKSFAPNAAGLYDMDGNVSEWLELLPAGEYDAMYISGWPYRGSNFSYAYSGPDSLRVARKFSIGIGTESIGFRCATH